MLLSKEASEFLVNKLRVPVYVGIAHIDQFTFRQQLASTLHETGAMGHFFRCGMRQGVGSSIGIMAAL